MIVFLRLLCAHILTDFYFQTAKVCENKNRINEFTGWKYQILHALVHSLSAYLVLVDFTNWIIPLFVFVTHFIVDIIKSLVVYSKVLQFESDYRVLLIDQVIHIFVLCILAFNIDCDGTIICCSENEYIWACVISYLIILRPTSIFIGKFVQQWQEDLDIEVGLKDAGKWIGYAERILALTFVLLNQYEALGFLIAAKSLLRFQDKDTKRTEYVLIGTLFSFGIAILLGLFVKLL